MKASLRMDRLTKRINSLYLEAEKFEEQRILADLMRAITTAGSKVAVKCPGKEPIVFCWGEQAIE